jgi:hypothetical protein
MSVQKIIRRVKISVAALAVFTATVGGVCGGPQPQVIYAGHWQTIGQVKVCVPYGKDCFVVDFKK